MLLQFNFKNFKSFRDDATLDLTATKITEYSNHVVSIANERVLPVAAIFGANASGKSNIQEAFRFMHLYVLKSFLFGGDDTAKRNNRRSMKPTPFLLDRDSCSADSTFEVFFIDEENGDKEYNYGFSVGQEGISEEWLRYSPKSSHGKFKRIFYRCGSQLDMPGISPKHQENIRIALQKETLVVSLGAKLKNARLRSVWKWFEKNDVADFGKPFESFVISNQLPEGFVDNEAVQADVVRYFSTFDSSIIGFDVEKIDKGEDDDQDRYKIYAIHKMIGKDDVVKIPLKQESAGTLKMFALYPILQAALRDGGVLFVDELNARLHPLLVRMLTVTFTQLDTNPKHAQLIFTTHDAWQLNNSSLRRDEIWFVEKSADGVSSLYSLADFSDDDGDKIRKDENFEKNYMLGKYGAIPTMKLIDISHKGD